MKYVPKLPSQNVNVSKTHPLKELALLCSGLVAIFAAIFLLLGVSVDLLAPHVPRELEEMIGERFDAIETVEPRHNEYLNDLVAILAPHLPHEAGAVRVGVIDDPMENAFALPGGRIFLTTGLIENVESENELAMVLAHEMGHCANRDHLRLLGRGLVMALLASLVIQSEDAIDYFLGPTLNLGILSHSRKREKEADLYALAVVVAAYGHGGGARDFFNRIDDKHGESMPPRYLSSHPAPYDRVGYLGNKLGEWAVSANGDMTPLPQWWKHWDHLE